MRAMHRTVGLLPLVGLLVLTAAAGASAQDACLGGAATLGDQRAIATLRTDVEAACPCAAATSRGSFRRCARDVLDAALDGGTLRAECKKTGKSIVAGAACGSTRVPCGRVKDTASVPVSCKVKRDTACTDTARIEATACDALAYCSDVVEFTAATCSDVRARGPFGAGVRQIPMTKQSVVEPSEPRTLDTYVWYPTTPGAGPIDPSTNAVLDAPVDASGGPYPIVLFSHGSCGYSLQSVFLMPLIAARGYVVVAPPHPGNTLLDGLAVCGSPQAQLDSAQERPADMRFVLDEVLAANADAGSDFFGVLDPTRVAMTGHSFGGFTTFLVAAQDPRITVALPMAPATPNGFTPFAVPSLIMLGEIDGRVSNPNAREAFAQASAPKFLVEIQDAGHYAFSNLCFPSPDCQPPATLTQDEAHTAVLRWVIPFLEWKLGGKEEFASFFDAPQPAGVVVERAE
jgi:predicted dienelactone hydrolase